MQNLTPKSVKEKLEQERDSVCFVDVRSEDEFSSGHVPGATCMPLDKIESGEVKVPSDRLVVLSCQSGKRSARAKELLRSRGFNNVIEMEGGFSAWAGEGFPVNRFRKTIPIIRQVMITAGSLVLIGALLGLVISPVFLVLPIFIGAGLTFAGVTGWCGLALLLEQMPWNRNSSLAA
jgi:rhodanese-related sulfurtransferase